jgi:hypothetical protein
MIPGKFMRFRRGTLLVHNIEMRDIGAADRIPSSAERLCLSRGNHE